MGYYRFFRRNGGSHRRFIYGGYVYAGEDAQGHAVKRFATGSEYVVFRVKKIVQALANKAIYHTRAYEFARSAFIAKILYGRAQQADVKYLMGLKQIAERHIRRFRSACHQLNLVLTPEAEAEVVENFDRNKVPVGMGGVPLPAEVD